MDLYKALALAGGTSTAVGGGILVSRSSLFQGTTNPVTTQKKETFRDRYIAAILAKEDELWNSKFGILKGTAEPAHPTLKNAKERSKTNENEAKDLHKQGCSEIYDSELESSPHFKDFQTYCAKTMKDGIAQGETWSEQAHTESVPWNTKLTNLHSHNEGQKGVLSDSLKKVKEQISTGSESIPNWNESKRKALKDWCDETKVKVFLGEEEAQFKNAKLYCVGN
ncbi:hypothetical protein HF1_07840 [Mycoplasma haemofelis str. Langford 1]|uniref:Uncharacterized protein n=1 Tax=Mycoplasma haemofelis (strain Langford 1) TaxID=941640 RepID=E8ZI21_MYCHL|nr:hypothetical protein [Mycoplasma haemofelis]CBY92792.1 hypothetical protein HF1_07840 [Mycoplasma haemofelis str. Langford 1]